MSKCILCDHVQTCKFKDNYDELIEKLNKIIDKDSNFTADLNCKYYRQNNFDKLVSQPISWPNIKYEEYNHCTNCINNPKYKSDFTTAGDSVCQWCPYNPYKLTCSSTYDLQPWDNIKFETKENK